MPQLPDRLPWRIAAPIQLLLFAASWLLLLLIVSAVARAQPAPAPLFSMRPIGALCGAAADHLRVLADNGFEPAWSGDGGRGGGAFLAINDDGYWILLIVFPEAPGQACVVADGPRFTYSPAPTRH